MMGAPRRLLNLEPTPPENLPQRVLPDHPLHAAFPCLSLLQPDNDRKAHSLLTPPFLLQLDDYQISSPCLVGSEIISWYVSMTYTQSFPPG